MIRPEMEMLKKHGYLVDHAWQSVDLFEKKVAEFFGAPFGIATDSCTHALELCFRLLDRRDQSVQVPVHTYMSVPMMLIKINQSWKFNHDIWSKFYTFNPLPIVDAAYLWQKNSYITNTLMCLSFQFKKHLPIGRGGMILTDNKSFYVKLQRLCRDGRDRQLLQTEDDITEIGYHYHMTPEDAARGVLLFDELAHLDSTIKGWQNYRPLTEFTVFKNLRSS